LAVTEIDGLVEPLDQTYETPLLAVSVVLPPTQIAGFSGVTVMFGNGFMITAAVATDEQPEGEVPVTE
jgi:hypothetical protein